jgi:hypothetical protein
MNRVLGYGTFQYIQKEILNPLNLKHTFGSIQDVNIDDVMSGYYVGYNWNMSEIMYNRIIRKIYNRVDSMIHKYYTIFNNKIIADLIYLLMKLLEWLFLITLYTFDKKPENRIELHYLDRKDRNYIDNKIENILQHKNENV